MQSDKGQALQAESPKYQGLYRDPQAQPASGAPKQTINGQRRFIYIVVSWVGTVSRVK